ncbi:MAG: hypothetical protein KC621_19110 [Myxococcales bacterium]|nr:hypothetical protein [Myxococcales bacterium]
MLLPVTLALLTPTAEAGGVGVLATGGMHNEKLYFYSDADPDGNMYPSLADYDQYQLSETLGHGGGGLEFLLGDRDDKIIGVTRFYYLADLPQTDPASVTSEVDPAHVVAEYRDSVRHLGVGLIGLTWGIVGDPNGFQFNAVGHMGAAFVTTDHTEFLTVDIGPGVSYRVARQVQLFADATYQMRYRKGFTHSGNVFLGARYMFD